jgi:hypothetical protein
LVISASKVFGLNQRWNSWSSPINRGIRDGLTRLTQDQAGAKQHTGATNAFLEQI